ncbi:MAG TPA: hypothetical protein VGM14_28690 [Streptosporangiaceae bacterium]|jgi:hypothetical protein
MTSADLCRPAEPGLATETGRRRRSNSIVPLTIAVCCAVIGLDQILHTTPATFAASPLGQVVHWAVDVVLAVPFAAAAIWAGGWLSGKLGIGQDTSGVFAQACVITLVLAVLLVPAWFAHYAVDSLAPSVAPVAGAAGHAGHAGHDHGGAPPVAVSWVGGGVLYLLMAIPLAAAAICVGLRTASKLSGRLTGEPDVVVRAVVSIGATALALAIGWFLAGVASQANGLVTYANGLTAVHLQHLVHAHLSTVYGVVVQPPFGYQLASAAQDALAGQAVGLPVIFAGLLWLTRRQASPNRAHN